MTGRGENAQRRRLRYQENGDVTVELSWHGITHVGNRRENNQDSYVLAPPLFAVADGMGGHAGGEVAASAVTKRLEELAGASKITDGEIVAKLQHAVSDIADELGDAAQGAGTTVTGVTFGTASQTPSWTVFNIGDSRVYQFFKGSLTQITTDHSVVQHLVDSGAITPDEADIHPHANVITRAVGLNEIPEPDTVELALVPGQRLLLCSDGLTKELTDLGLQHFLAQAETVQEAAEMLISQSLGNAGRDNVTVIVIEVHAVSDDSDTFDINGATGSDDISDNTDPRTIPVVLNRK